MVLSVKEAQGRDPASASPNSDLPSLTLECRRPKLLELVKETILAALWAYKLSAPFVSASRRGDEGVAALMGAVKARRTRGF